MHRVSRRRLVQTVVALIKQRPQDQRKILQMLAAYMIVHKQQKQVDLVILELAQELQMSFNHLHAEVTSAFPLETVGRAELEKYLRDATGAKSVELDERVDADLLAGMVVRTAELELDTSARTKLKRLSSLNVNTPREA